MKLPEDFLARMRPLFGEESEFRAFLSSFDESSRYGIRAHPPRLDVAALAALLPAMGEPAPLGPVPWCPDGLRIGPGSAPGRHPLHEAGLFYLQEPSAMLPVEVLAPVPGERVLDLCAAPGGKSVQIAARMNGEGFLLANDVHADRARALVRNLERFGIAVAMVAAEEPDRLADRLPGFFDRILVDAPCSGEGMFRRDPASASRWPDYSDGRCERLQASILDAAHRLLAPGGRLVYSTCTFSPAEDEDAVAAFLVRHPGYRSVSIPRTSGLSDAVPRGGDPAMACAVRIWPHRSPGDGHFCACLEKEGERPPKTAGPTASETVPFPPLAAPVLDAFDRFAGPVLAPEAAARLRAWLDGARCATLSGDHIHVLPLCPPDLSGLHVLKKGFHFGSLQEVRSPRGGSAGLRFEPSHSLALLLRREDLLRVVDLPVEDGTALRYLKGETVTVEEDGEPLAPGGTAAACVLGHPLGWVRPMGRGMCKNLYPPGWRRR